MTRGAPRKNRYALPTVVATESAKVCAPAAHYSRSWRLLVLFGAADAPRINKLRFWNRLTRKRSSVRTQSRASSTKIITPLSPHTMTSDVRQIAPNRCQPLRAMPFSYSSLTTHNPKVGVQVHPGSPPARTKKECSESRGWHFRRKGRRCRRIA